MFTRIQPAGNLFDYCESSADFLDRARPVPPQRLRGDRTVVENFLWAVAPAALRPNRRRKTGPTRPRPRPGWVRHCQEHLVHLINCYIEPHAEIEPHLTRILQGTEDLILAGLPRPALNFVWYKHAKDFGTHPHGGLLRQILPHGPGYVPNLNPELLFAFDRLVSRRFGLADPLDPAGMRLAYAAWASAKPANEAEITAVCEGVADQYRWRGPDFTHAVVLEVCQALGLPILAAPDRSGQPRRFRSDRFPQLQAPLRRQTVVVASRDGQRAICFAGPACSAFFEVARYEAEVEARRRQVAELRDHPEILYERFRHLLAERMAHQRDCYGGGEPGVTERNFTRLGEWVTPARPAVAAALARAPGLQRWSERAYPFATDADLQMAYAVDFRAPAQPPDLTNPEVGLLHEACDEQVVQTEAAAWQWEEQHHACQIGMAIGQAHDREQVQLRQEVVAVSLRVAVAIGGRFQAEQERLGWFHQRQAVAIAIAVGQRAVEAPRRCRQQQIQVTLGVTLQVGQWHFAELRRRSQAPNELTVRIAAALREQELAERAQRARQQLRLSLAMSGRVGRCHQAEREQRRRQRVRHQAVTQALRVHRRLEDWSAAHHRGRQQLALQVSITIGSSFGMEQEQQMKLAQADTLARLQHEAAQIKQQLTSLAEQLPTHEAVVVKCTQRFLTEMPRLKSAAWVSDFLRQPRATQLERLTKWSQDNAAKRSQHAELQSQLELRIGQEQSALRQEETALRGKLTEAAGRIGSLEALILQLQLELKTEKSKLDMLRKQQQEQATGRQRAEAGWAAERAQQEKNTTDLEAMAKYFAEFAGSIRAVAEREASREALEGTLAELDKEIAALGSLDSPPEIS